MSKTSNVRKNQIVSNTEIMKPECGSLLIRRQSHLERTRRNVSIHGTLA